MKLTERKALVNQVDMHIRTSQQDAVIISSAPYGCLRLQSVDAWQGGNQ